MSYYVELPFWVVVLMCAPGAWRISSWIADRLVPEKPKK